RNAKPFREVVAVYTTRNQGVITVSSGSDASISARMKQINKVMDSPSLA
ncbi:MAG: hypothetical protein H7123_04840, partial [Thermoleophilia bacterium]|nr:hypothetical protein [Thermoleophilia bacterium]